MLDDSNVVREGRSTIEYGNHHHTVGQAPCLTCEIENESFKQLSKHGAHGLEEKMHRLPSYRAYNQRWPFDARKNILSAEVVFEDSDGIIYIEGYENESILDRIASQEAVEELLKELTPSERDVIEMTVGGYRPREIAALKGEANSARVRQDKYSALRKLGAPLNQNMRRSK